MQQHFTFHIHTCNEPAVLPRILLIFSRRRLRLEAMQFFDLQAGKPAELQIDLHCEAKQANDVFAQLNAIVEEKQVWSECGESTQAAA